MTEVTKWAWLEIFHLTDVFDVVLVSHPLPTPTQLWWYLNRASLTHIETPPPIIPKLRFGNRGIFFVEGLIFEFARAQ